MIRWIKSKLFPSRRSENKEPCKFMGREDVMVRKGVKVVSDEDDPYRDAILNEAFRTGRAVVGNIDEEGNLNIQHLGEDKKDGRP